MENYMETGIVWSWGIPESRGAFPVPDLKDCDILGGVFIGDIPRWVATRWLPPGKSRIRVMKL